MTHKELYKALLNLETIKVSIFEGDDIYIHMNLTGNLVCSDGTLFTGNLFPSYCSIKKPEKYQVLYKDPKGTYWTTLNRYESREDFQTYRTAVGTQFIKLLKGE